MKEILEEILKNTSPWEILLFGVVIYFLANPDLRSRIKKIKFGDFELELEALKSEVKRGKEKIAELAEEVEGDRRLFEDILASFDPDAPVRELATARQAIKAKARTLSEVESLRGYLSLDSKAEELFAAAVTIREIRPVQLLPDLVEFLDQVASKSDLGGFRLNTIWTLTSALHLTLIASIRDGIDPKPNKESLLRAKQMLSKLIENPSVQRDRPDNPAKGIRGPARHAQNWVNEGLKEHA